MQKRKITWRVLVIGVLMLMAAAGCYRGKNLLPVKNENDEIGVLYPSFYQSADLSEDGSSLAANDNYERILVIDTETEKLKWFIDAAEEGYDSFENEYFYQDLLYIYATNYGDEGDVTKYLLAYDLSGELCDSFVLEEGVLPHDGEAESLGFSDGHAYFLSISEEAGTIHDMDLVTGELMECGSFDVLEHAPIVWSCFDAKDPGYILTFMDQEFGRLSLDGTYELINKLIFTYGDDSPNNIMVDQVTVSDGRIFILDKKMSDVVYTYEQGNVTPYITFDELFELEGPHDEEYQRFWFDNLLFPLKAEENGVGICGGVTYFFVDDSGVVLSLSGEDGYEMPSDYKHQYQLSIVLNYAALLLAVIGLVLVIGSLMRWHFSTMAKMFFIILPIVIISFAITAQFSVRQMEKTYYDQTRDQFLALSSVIVGSLDGDLIESFDSSESYNSDDYREFLETMDTLLNTDSGWNLDGTNVELFRLDKETGVHRELYSLDVSDGEDIYYLNFYYRRYDSFAKKADQVIDENTYFTGSSRINQSIFEIIKMISNSQGENIAFLCISNYADKLETEVQEMQKEFLLRMIILLALLSLALFLISLYITSNLRKASAAIYRISQGDFSSRIDRIQKDELGAISTGINHMAQQIENMFDESNEFSLQVIETLVSTIDAKDKYTNGHSVRVAEYAREIARRAGKDDQYLKSIYYAGLLHDIGKIGIPDEIINKPGRLTNEEYAVIKSHPSIGYDILKKLPKLENITVGAYGHHERIDGRGYPQGLKGDEIPEIARIIGVADAYDAMTSNRSYRNGLPQEKVRSELENSKSTQLDADYVDIMLQIDIEKYPKGYE